MSWADKRHRNVQKLITFSPEEWEHVLANWRACQADPRWERFGDWAREALSTVEIRPIAVRTDPMPLRGEIRRIGVNINETVRLANRSRAISDERIGELTGMLAQVRDLLAALSDETEQAALIARGTR